LDMDDDLLVGQDSFDSSHNSASAFAILKDDFLDLGDETDIKAYLSQHETTSPAEVSPVSAVDGSASADASAASAAITLTEKLSSVPTSKMDDWDQDVLLSNAGLPEMNPLLELGDGVEDDFQKMLNEWENHMDSLQANEGNQGETPQYILPVSMEDQKAQRQSSSGDDSSCSQTATAASSPLIGGGCNVNDDDDDLDPESAPAAASASIFSSSNNDDSGASCFVDASVASAVIKKEVVDDEEEEEEEEDDYEEEPEEEASIKSEAAAAVKPPSKQSTRPNLTGIVISCGPGGHFETYEVLEASDSDTLLEQFEQANKADLFREFAGKNPKSDTKRSQIVDAVQNHFSAKNGGNTSKKKPRIVPSYRIKDALPREVIEKIKSSSAKSRTIAIIEPVLEGRTNATFNHLNSTPYEYTAKPPAPPPPPPQPTVVRQLPISSHYRNRFQEAASSLNRSKHYRHIGHHHPVPPPAVTPPPPPPPPIQVTLDHDYCSSVNKVKRPMRPTPPLNAYQTRTSPITGSRTITYSSRREFVTTAASVNNRNPQTVTAIKKAPIVVTSSSGLVATSAAVTRPYVRVSTGSRVVTANLLKPSPSVIKLDNTKTGVTKFRQVTARPAVTAAKASTPTTVVCLQKQRRDSDASTHRKDSGLDSGDTMSDTSEPKEDPDSSAGYSKVPSYLTSIAVKNSDSLTVTPAEEAGYDRLPAYIRGVPNKAGQAVTVAGTNTRKRVVIVHASEARATTRRAAAAAAAAASNPAASEGGGPGSRERHCSSSSSEGSTTSMVDNRQTVIPDGLVVAGVSTRSMTTRTAPRRRSSSSTSSEDGGGSGSGADRKKRKRAGATRSSPGPASRRARLEAAVGSNGNGRFTRDRQRREQECRQQDQEHERRNEERRIVYVGKIAEGTTRADLRKRFEVFGPILEISVHFRDRGDNYGFITFKYKVDAYEAIEHGNDDPSYPTVDLCFGGRRAFCKEKYSDLDSHINSALDPGEVDKYRLRGSSAGGGGEAASKQQQQLLRGGRGGGAGSGARGGGGGSNDFDSLLQQARAGLNKKQQQVAA